MSLEDELLIQLNSEKETFTKKLQYATNCFKSSELPVECKIILLKWILSKTDESVEIWITLQNWLNSNSFKEITRNEISSKDVKAIVEMIIIKINSENEDISITSIVCNIVTIILRNRTFEQYFKIDLEVYLKLINCTLLRIECSNQIIDFINSHLFYKSLLNAHDFMEHFVNIIFPTLVKIAVKFDNRNVFLQISRVVQKCIFYNNHRNFGNFINKIFGSDDPDQCELQILLKYLSNTFQLNKKSVEFYFKLAFHGCTVCYESDSLLIYKFFLILIHTVGFKYELIPLNNSLIHNSSEIQQTKKSYKILLELLGILEETKLETNCKINEINVTELLKTILIESIIIHKQSKTNYQIVKKIILLDPTISQVLTEHILNYSLLSNKTDHEEEYEELMLIILEVFSKLHRTENFVSKLVVVLNNYFDSAERVVDLQDLKMENVLTMKILQSFSRNIQSLASWQVINVFKTFIFAFRRLLENKSKEVESDTDAHSLHLEFLSELIGVFLSSIRVAEHTVAANVVEKTKKCLKELEDLLHTFGKQILNRKHNCSLMRSFLNIANYWAEVGIVLKYYSVNQDDVQKKALENNFSACNITYLHPYLSVEEWCLISERINNFGEIACKHLLHKLFIQKVRALSIFEQKINDEILVDLSRYLTSDLENSWKDILQNKLLTNILIPTLDPSSKNFIAEKFVVGMKDFENLNKNLHIFNNTSILNAVIYCTIIKCDKILSKRKRKFEDDSTVISKISTNICNVMTLNQFYNEDEQINCINKITKLYESSNKINSDIILKFNENKVLELIEVFKKFPVIFCPEFVQKFFILYIFSLHKDLNSEFAKGNYKNLQMHIEYLIIGVLQQYKYRLTDIFNIKSLFQEVLSDYDEWKEVFILIIDNIFKNKDSIVDYESLILHIVDKLHNPMYMQCGIIIINTVNKLRKVKMSKEIKTVAENYKSTICNKICDLVLKNQPNEHLILAYAYVLKTFFAQNDEQQISKLLNVMTSYINFALEREEEFDKIGYLLLFNTVFQNKPKIKEFDEDLPLKIWQICKTNKKVFSRIEEFSQLMLLMICYISNDQFNHIIKDLSVLSEHTLKQNNYEEFGFLLKTWESIFTANINPIKTKNLQEEVQKLLSDILAHLENSEYNKNFYKNLFKFEILLVQTNHFHLTPPMIDILILNVTVLLGKEDIDFQLFFNLAISLLSNLLKYRKSLIMDRLPPYLQQYRALLRSLCQKSNSDTPIDEHFLRDLADCAYQLEKLTKSLAVHQKDMSRIAMYLIADILEQYEKVTIYPNIKMHLNNCIYSLVTICDQHAVSYLMRVLSSASTEIFKVMYENYKKYYRFTGKA